MKIPNVMQFNFAIKYKIRSNNSLHWVSSFKERNISFLTICSLGSKRDYLSHSLTGSKQDYLSRFLTRKLPTVYMHGRCINIPERLPESDRLYYTW
ncbi:Hypothetical predicted protein [Octopus vulgaris]|uniref:Uncharacterized protein n=1 Tax=Octopus vulgaris TaxID=6645 RepID=A0AA36AXR2_OCTVU|nr:Hypothetical predicted protein [Octopus vulgaris]